MPEIADVVFEETIEEEWGNAIRDRTVQRYDDLATRTSEHAAPTAGDLSYLEDSGDLDVYHSGAWRHVGSPVATVEMQAGGSVPPGWLLCNGQEVSRTTYAALFAAIGTTHGAGDGSTTFLVPDFRGRVPFGVAVSGTGAALGDAFGSVDHSHTNPNTGTTGSHAHTQGSTGQDTHSHGAGGLYAQITMYLNKLWQNRTSAASTLHNFSAPVSQSDDLGSVANATNVSGSTATDVHSHTNPNTGSTGDHAHTQGSTGANNPPSLAVHFRIKT